jgi:hypothetical protein
MSAGTISSQNMSSTNSSRSNSPIFSALDDFDYIRALEKHSNLDSILPPQCAEQAGQQSSLVREVSTQHPQVKRTFSELEESNSAPKSKRSIISAFMNLGARTSGSRTRSFARQTTLPSGSQRPGFSVPVNRLARGTPSRSLSFLDDEDVGIAVDKKRRRQPDSGEPQFIVDHVEGLHHLHLTLYTSHLSLRSRKP